MNSFSHVNFEDHQLHSVQEHQQLLPMPYLCDTYYHHVDMLVVPYSATPSSHAPRVIPKKPKRQQVRNACTNCQKACKKCDDGRACKRCIKLSLEATCVNSPRKSRRKGVKRGPYKKRQEEKATIGAEMTEQGNHQQQELYALDWFDPVLKIDTHFYNTPIPTTNTIATPIPNQQTFLSSFQSEEFFYQQISPALSSATSITPIYYTNDLPLLAEDWRSTPTTCVDNTTLPLLANDPLDTVQPFFFELNTTFQS